MLNRPEDGEFPNKDLGALVADAGAGAAERPDPVLAVLSGLLAPREPDPTTVARVPLILAGLESFTQAFLLMIPPMKPSSVEDDVPLGLSIPLLESFEFDSLVDVARTES